MPSMTALPCLTTRRQRDGASVGGPSPQRGRVSRSILRPAAVRRLAAVLLWVATPADAAAEGWPEHRGAGRQGVGTPATQEVGRPNFSGWWTLDPDATTLTPPAFSGGRGGADIDRLFITHAANDTVIVGPETNGLKAWSYTPGRAGDDSGRRATRRCGPRRAGTARASSPRARRVTCGCTR